MNITATLLLAGGVLLSSSVGAESEFQDVSPVDEPMTPAELQEQIDIELQEHPGAVQISANEISFEGGSVVLTIPQDPIVSVVCPGGSYCFYQHSNFRGRMLRFGACRRYNFGDYAFRDKTSSWWNRTGLVIRVYDERTRLPDEHLWTENPSSRSALVSAGKNDKADYSVCH